MTLIVSGINKNYAFAATDTLVTKGGVLHDSDAVKSMRVDTSDGSFLFTYTGLAELRHGSMDGGMQRNIPTAHVLAMELSDYPASLHTVIEVIDFLCNYLRGYMEKNHSARAERLTIVVSGWLLKGAKVTPKLYVITNGEDMNRNWLKVPTHSFHSYEATNQRLTVHGYMPATTGADFEGKLRYVKKLLPKEGLTDFEVIRDKMAELIGIAAAHPRGRQYIGDKVMGLVLNRGLTGGDIPAMDFRYYPDISVWIGPNVVGRTMSIIEPQVHSDPLAGTGGTINIGGSHSLPYNVLNDGKYSQNDV